MNAWFGSAKHELNWCLFQLKTTTKTVQHTKCLHYFVPLPIRFSDFNGKLSVPKVDIFNLIPLEDLQGKKMISCSHTIQVWSLFYNEIRIITIIITATNINLLPLLLSSSSSSSSSSKFYYLSHTTRYLLDAENTEIRQTFFFVSAPKWVIQLKWATYTFKQRTDSPDLQIDKQTKHDYNWTQCTQLPFWVWSCRHDHKYWSLLDSVPATRGYSSYPRTANNNWLPL